MLYSIIMIGLSLILGIGGYVLGDTQFYEYEGINIVLGVFGCLIPFLYSWFKKRWVDIKEEARSDK